MRLKVDINGVFLDDTEKGINFWNGLSEVEKEEYMKNCEAQLHAFLLEQADITQTFNIKVSVEDISK